MKIKSPLIRAYRNCGFHNRTLKELRADPSLSRGAVLDPADPHLAHVPNIFGSFRHKGIHYHTSLSLVGLDESGDYAPDQHPRGVSVIREIEIEEGRKLWQFKIMIPKRFCEEDLCPDGKKTDPVKFCMALRHRTDIFAMEFLCCYRFFIEQVQETYELGNSAVREPLRETDDLIHPKREEADALICTYDAVARHLEWFKTEYADQGWKFENIQEFIEMHVGRNRKAMSPYYRKWLEEHRVDPSLVEKKTIEYVAMAFLDHEHEN